MKKNNVYDWGYLKNPGDIMTLGAYSTAKVKSVRNSARQQGMRIKTFQKPNGSFDVLLVEYVKEWCDKYGKEYPVK